MTERPDFRQGARLPDERIVCGDRALRSDPDDLAEVVVQFLRTIAVVEAIPEGHEEVAVASEHQARSPVVATRRILGLSEDDPDIAERVLVQYRPGHRGPAAAAGRFGEAEENGPVAGESGAGHHVQQASLTAGGTVGRFAIGSDRRPSLATRLRRPDFSVTSMVASGRKQTDQGRSSPSATVTILKRAFSEDCSTGAAAAARRGIAAAVASAPASMPTARRRGSGRPGQGRIARPGV